MALSCKQIHVFVKMNFLKSKLRHIQKSKTIWLGLRTCSRSFSEDAHYTDLTKLSTKKYWKEFYSKSELNQNEQFDWFLDAETVCEQLDTILDSNDIKEPLRILDIGCGTSSIPTTLCSYSKRPLDLHCVDFIQSALCQQQSWLSKVKFKNPQTLTHFIVSDDCRLPYKDSLFDVIIDKGTMDALLKDKKCGNVNGHTMVLELARVSKDNGAILQISDEDPDIRLPLLESWSVSDEMLSVKWTSTVLKSFGSIEYFAFYGTVSKTLVHV